MIGVTSCAAANENGGESSTTSGGTAAELSGTLSGAGSSAQQAAMQVWRSMFQQQHPEVTVNYDPIGSGGGREQFLAGGVAFAGSDDYLAADELAKAQDRCGGPPIEIPVYVSPIAVVYNLPEAPKLKLDAPTLAKIFTGQITHWDAKAIAVQNPGVDLPALRITPVHRSDESGTTGNFTDYLSQAAPQAWTHGVVENWPIKTGGAADGTSGVVAAVKEGTGAIGYADASQTQDMSTVSVKSGSGYVGPQAQAAAAILDHSKPVPNRGPADLALTLDRTPDAAGIYPIVLVSYQIMCPKYENAQTAQLVRAFQSYVISEAGQHVSAKHAGSAPITDTMRKKAQAAIARISSGETLSTD